MALTYNGFGETRHEAINLVLVSKCLSLVSKLIPKSQKLIAFLKEGDEARNVSLIFGVWKKRSFQYILLYYSASDIMILKYIIQGNDTMLS